MAYTLDIALNLGAGQTGLTLSAQLVDTAGVNVGSAVLTGFSEQGAGYYLWHYAAFPDNFRGGVVFSAGGVVKAFSAVNPEEAITAATPATGTSYVTLAQIRAELGITDGTDTTDDSKLDAARAAASRAIDNHCPRRFYLDDAASARIYTAEEGDLLRLDDIGSLTDLAVKTDEDGDRVYETTWAATDYDLEPANAAADGKPFTRLYTAPSGRYSLPTTRRGVEITAKWGWPAVPSDVARACMILAVRLYKRRDAPFGVAGSAETGLLVLPKNDPDVGPMLQPYVRMGIGGV